MRTAEPEQTTASVAACRQGHDAATQAIRAQAEIIVAAAPLVCDLDMDGIHDMRVASRRLRMALRVYRPYLPRKQRKALGRHAKRITNLLGSRRELDVMVAMLREHRRETRTLWRRFMDHAIGILEERQELQVEYCRDAALLAESGAFRGCLTEVLDGIDAADCCVLTLAAGELADALDTSSAALRYAKRTGDPDHLHGVRITLKHLRYACEFHGHVYGGPMGEFIARVKDAQALLGEWNECRLLEDMVRTLGGAAAYDLAQGAPLVAEAYRNRAIELAEQFKPVGKALLGKESRTAFAAILEAPVFTCCDAPGDGVST